ncbi:MAG: hypothetical protein BWZ07_02966 [Alphaproteobacteria bacterium ADurb.BinA280]|nr:MAG: hypothetical protein BWZ07_02966 [Alphaproteobacteria bacterium ADurb.BinA280]
MVHNEEGPNQRDRQRQGNDERAPAIAQEEEDDQYGQNAAFERGIRDFIQRFLDENRLIINGHQTRLLGQIFAQAIQLLAHCLGDRHRVGIAFLVDRQLNGFAALHANNRFAFLEGLLHRGNVAQSDRHALIDRNQQVLHLLDRAELIDCAHQVALTTFVNGATGDVDVLNSQPIDHALRIEVQLRHSLRIEQNLYLILQAA